MHTAWNVAISGNLRAGSTPAIAREFVAWEVVESELEAPRIGSCWAAPLMRCHTMEIEPDCCGIFFSLLNTPSTTAQGHAAGLAWPPLPASGFDPTVLRHSKLRMCLCLSWTFVAARMQRHESSACKAPRWFLAEIQLSLCYEQWPVEELVFWSCQFMSIWKAACRLLLSWMGLLFRPGYLESINPEQHQAPQQSQETQQLGFQELFGQRQWIEDIGVGTRKAEVFAKKAATKSSGCPGIGRLFTYFKSYRWNKLSEMNASNVRLYRFLEKKAPSWISDFRHIWKKNCQQKSW